MFNTRAIAFCDTHAVAALADLTRDGVDSLIVRLSGVENRDNYKCGCKQQATWFLNELDAHALARELTLGIESGKYQIATTP